MRFISFFNLGSKMLWVYCEILVISGLSVSTILIFENMIIVNILLLYIQGNAFRSTFYCIHIAVIFCYGRSLSTMLDFFLITS